MKAQWSALGKNEEVRGGKRADCTIFLFIILLYFFTFSSHTLIYENNLVFTLLLLFYLYTMFLPEQLPCCSNDGFPFKISNPLVRRSHVIMQ